LPLVQNIRQASVIADKERTPYGYVWEQEKTKIRIHSINKDVAMPLLWQTGPLISYD
jgi:hypothetical protein